MSRWRRFLWEDLRYENGRWPLWRWDQNLRYIAKSLLQRPEPRTAADAAAHAAMSAYLAARGPAQRTGALADSGAVPVRLCAAGDLMWIRSGWASALSPLVRALFGAADLVLANLETPIVPELPVKRLTYETLRYNAPPAYLDPLRPTRPGAACVLSLCNNHALDQGVAGLRRTRAVVNGTPGLHCVGGPAAGEELLLLRVAGLTVACLGLTFGINWAEQLAPAEQPAGIPVLRFGDPRSEPDWPRLVALLQRARGQGADYVIVLAHWGFEYEHFPDALQRRQAHRLLALGADLIIGSSPHVLQPLEVISLGGWDPACPVQLPAPRPRAGIIAYSLGNFASIMPTRPCRTGAALQLDLVRTTGGELAPLALRVHPTVSRGGVPGWLDVQVQTLAELAQDPRARAAAAAQLCHAQRTLGPLIADDLPSPPPTASPLLPGDPFK